ncbi:hypothetical protein CAP36_11125 [Chitinophagaceae bacterium IBVUCB2]|nr:hypothetical protein CAP36_11125 [Chitinophagaceae bacterium IBVUCB2]
MKRKLLMKSGLLILVSLGFCYSLSAQLTISVPRTFASLDNSIDDSDPAVGIFEYAGNLTIATGGNITNNDVGGSGNSAGDITIVVTGSLTLQAGAAILAENNINGGSGGDITITVGGNFTMATGAVISSSKTSGSGDTGITGDISIDVTGPVNISAGAAIRANGTGTSGDISITGDRNIVVAGTVESVSGMTGPGGPQPQGAGSIFIITNCNIVIEATGKVSSFGQDPGADLVHLEACTVTINGLVESTGEGHATPAIPTKLVPPFRPDKPSESTAGVEVWANTIVINPTGQVNADLSLGAGKRSWIDLFARNNIIISGAGSGAVYAVHANVGGNGGEGGIITAKSIAGSVITSGQAIQSNGFGSGIRRGGPVTVEANNNLNFTGSLFQANGANFGGLFTFRASTGNINMDNTTSISVTGSLGAVNNTACGTIGNATYSAGAIVVSLPGVCTPAPVLPVYVTLPPASCVQLSNCDQNITLPVSFVSFTARRINSAVSLTWVTGTEINNQGFEIQRQLKNSNLFETVGFVNSRAVGGNSTSELQYSFSDPNSFADASLYRIKQMDLDGKFKYSEVRLINGIKERVSILTYPNPSSDGNVTVIFGSDDKKEIALSDISGRLVQKWSGYNNQQLKLTGLRSGTYILQVTDPVSMEKEIRKIVVSQ